MHRWGTFMKYKKQKIFRILEPSILEEERIENKIKLGQEKRELGPASDISSNVAIFLYQSTD